MGVYDRQIATAQRIIKAKGEACVWASQIPPTTPDPDKPWLITPGAPVEYPDVAIAFFPLERQFSELIRYLKGTDIVGGSLYGLMGAVDFVPQITDTVVRKDGTRLSIASIDPLAPNGEKILYTIEFKA